MKKRLKYYLFPVLIFLIQNVSAQIPDQFKHKIDSLNHIINNSKDDTILVKALFKLDDIIYAFDPIQDEEINNRIRKICEDGLKDKSADKKKKQFFKKDLLKAWNNLGIIYMYSSRNEQALKAYKRSLKLAEELKDWESRAKTNINLGILKYRAGDLAMAIEYYSAGLKDMEKAGNKDAIASTLNNLAMIYRESGDTALAIQYYKRSIKITKSVHSTQRTGTALVGLSDIVKKQGDIKKAIEMQYEALKYFKETEDVQGIASVCLNLGTELFLDGRFDEGKANLLQSLSLGKQYQDPRTVGLAYSALAEFYFMKKDNKMSFLYADSAFQILKRSSFLRETMQPALRMYSLTKSSDPKKALEMLEQYIQLKDSAERESNQRAVIQQQYRYEYEKKSAQDSVENASKEKLKDAELDKKNAELANQRNQQIFLFTGLGLLIIFLIFIINRFRITARQKNIIEKQKSEVELAHLQLEERNKEVLDSINYAKRIQGAILPSKKKFDSEISDYFILYKPKDIVAGDFYWLESSENYLMIAVADCTGHGVPGALVSVVCHGALNRSVREYKLTDPGKILDKTREIVVEEFSKNEEDVKDGMDISLIVINKKAKEIKWSGANNPLWYVTDGKWKEILPNKQPIGVSYNPVSFTTHTLSELSDNSTLYLFTDGYADQFGGPKGKKFKYSNLQKLLLDHSNLELETPALSWAEGLNLKLQSAFNEWKGDLEQVDDVCIIGIRV